MLKNMVACFLRFSSFCYHTPPRSEPSLSFISIVSMLLIFDYIPRSFSSVGSLTQKGSCQVCLESSWGGASPAPSVRLPSGPLVLERAEPQQVSAALLKVAHVAFQWIPVGYFKGLLFPVASFFLLHRCCLCFVTDGGLASPTYSLGSVRKLLHLVLS